MASKSFANYLGFGLSLTIITLIVFGLLHWLDVPAGQLADWALGLASFWWLLVIVTVPWNIYFQAKEVLAEAQLSLENRIAVDTQQLSYVRQTQKGSLRLAIVLHIVSAVVLYGLAATGVSSVGYISGGLALLLTALRPTVRAYEYVALRLQTVQQQVNYPREDVVELRQRVVHLENRLDLGNYDSWASEQQRQQSFLQEQQQELKIETRRELAELGVQVQRLQASNQEEHRQLAQEARQAIAQISADGQFLEHVREIIRFFKSA
ncbi:MAG: hypothetical protein NW237_04965 [Cyanobacteriota bacterium]|nr:hypothetical protein [Cyanobacteriota bacterium]